MRDGPVSDGRIAQPAGALMATIHPIVRHVIVCDGVGTGGNPQHPTVNIAGMAHVIRSKTVPPFPYTHPLLCVYVVLTGGVGTGRVQVVVSDGDTELPLIGSGVHEITHLRDRHEQQGLVFRLLDCVFHRSGLYWVEFWHDDVQLRREPLIVR